jgi:hypothetical protein
MNDLPRQKLVKIIARHGRAVANDHRRCEGLLRDYCSGYRREVAVLVSAMEERVAADLIAATPGLPREALLTKLAKRLHDDVAMEETAARWAVDSWALALGFVSGAELETIERAGRQPAPLKAAAATAAVESRPAASASPSDIVVSATGEGDYESLSEAMRNLPEGGRLFVRPGLYREGLVIDRAAEIIGDGKPEEIVIASASASCVSMQTDKAIVRGLTLRQEAGGVKGGEGFFAVDIRQGRLTLEDCDITSGSLSCVGIHNETTDAVIRRCRIHNSADSGIYIFHAAKGTVEACDIYDNRNVGLAITEGAFATVKQCSVREGRDAGIVVWNRAAAVIEGCDIFSNAKANVGISEEGNPILRQCRIYGGKNSGVFVHDDGQGTLEDCEIYNHAAAEVAVTLRGNLTISKCRIHDGEDSGLFISEEGRVMIGECEVFNNADAGVNVDTGGVAVIQRCLINRNGSVAVRVNEGGAAQIEECDLTGNEIAPWQADRGAHVEGRGNIL